MYSRSPLGYHLLGCRLPPLHTSSYQCIKRKYGITATGAQRIDCASRNLFTEVIVPPAIKQNLLSESDIDDETVVVDGGDDGNPSIRPPDGLKWHCLSVLGGKHLYVADETDPCRGLTFAHVDSVLPFIRLPWQQSLAIIDSISMRDIVCALEECEKLKKTAVERSDGKHIFGDYGKPVMYSWECRSLVTVNSSS